MQQLFIPSPQRMTSKSLIATARMMPNLKGLQVSKTSLTLLSLSHIISLLPHLVAVYADNIGGLDDEEDETTKKESDDQVVIKSQSLEVCSLMNYSEDIERLTFEVHCLRWGEGGS